MKFCIVADVTPPRTLDRSLNWVSSSGSVGAFTRTSPIDWLSRYEYGWVISAISVGSPVTLRYVSTRSSGSWFTDTNADGEYDAPSCSRMWSVRRMLRTL